ncbi:MAG: hypothetical protein KF831_12465 [Acidobacteria bacterium]|nr:hypothetical protein [Acidobacteriota bacterium]
MTVHFVVGFCSGGAVEYSAASFPADEAEKELHKEGRELLETEVEISGEPFSIDDFGPRKLTAGDFLSANDIVHLGWLIVERRDPQP